MITRILNSQTKTVTFAAIILGISALFSRLLGLFRDRLLAGQFGAGEELDIYFAAFRIPDFVYGILIMGGISAVFLPMFSEQFKKNEEDAWKLTNNILNCFLLLLILICGVLAIFTPYIINLVAPGFSEGNKEIAVSLTRIMFLSPIFFGLSNIFSGILHYFNRFLIYSLAPVFYNLGIIFGILFLVPVFGLYGLAYGVILGAAAHWLLQFPAAKISGFKYQAILNFRSPSIIKFFKLTIPRIIGAAAYHLNLIVITAIASTLAAGSITIFNFSNNLQYFPVGLIGVSFALASFPALSREWTFGNREKFLETFSSAFRQIIFLVIPISFLIFILRAQLIKIILGTGQFSLEDTRLTAASLGLFCLGIFAAALIPLLARAFYSFQDTKTPVLIGLISMIFNTVLAFFFVFLLKSGNSFQELMTNILNLQGIENISVVGLPLALSVSGIFQFLLLLVFLKKGLGKIHGKEILNSFKKIITAALSMGFITYFILYFLNEFLNTGNFLGLFLQTIIAGLGGAAIYVFLSLVLKSPELVVIKDSIKKQFLRE